MQEQILNVMLNQVLEMKKNVLLDLTLETNLETNLVNKNYNDFKRRQFFSLLFLHVDEHFHNHFLIFHSKLQYIFELLQDHYVLKVLELFLD